LGGGWSNGEGGWRRRDRRGSARRGRRVAGSGTTVMVAGWKMMEESREDLVAKSMKLGEALGLRERVMG